MFSQEKKILWEYLFKETTLNEDEKIKTKIKVRSSKSSIKKKSLPKFPDL